MALSKPSFLIHLKSLTTKPFDCRFRPPFLSIRLLSFATPEEAAAERRRRKRRLRIEPPLNSLRHPQPQKQQRTPSSANPNPNAPKLPETVSVLTGNRLNLHNRILTLIRENDLDEAALYTRHSVYSNCRPTIFTCNAVMAALLRQSRYADLLSLHRFITQAGIAANVVTYNLLITVYCECRKTDTALEHYKQLINNAPFNPSPTTYRILAKGLVDNSKVERAIELKDEMLSKGFSADPIVYSHLMNGCAKTKDADKIFDLYEELKAKLGGDVSDGIIYGGLMKGYFLKGLENEAMELYQEATREHSRIKMGAMSFNLILDALSKNGKFEEALRLFDWMKTEHNPPQNLTVNLGSYNVMVDGYCAEGRFKEAVEVFMRMDESRCSPDIVSFNNLIEQLCSNGLLPDAEELCGRMNKKKVNPDEVSYGLLMDTCFKENRPDDAAGYFRKMIDEKLRPNLAVYNRLVDGLVKFGKVDEAKSFFDLMVKKLKMDASSYEFMFKALCDVSKLDEVLKIVGEMLDDGSVDLNDDMQEIIKDGLRKEGREEELGKLIEQKEREKEEAKRREAEEAEKAKASARAAVASLLPSKLFGSKEDEKESTDSSVSKDDDVSPNKAAEQA
ncbi:hypothetical protein Nepgr_020605 [Nepenthes gracilis]|uniref:Pentatricopeptide repeat-containing protein n=1 Tax=Nepenthes gracilis TaxID=150966 RepID=A0AAD3XW83_NEPGR|nr:hypothetical protein Nepgr_020605 [Nepenthes gracilis]